MQRLFYLKVLHQKFFCKIFYKSLLIDPIQLLFIPYRLLNLSSSSARHWNCNVKLFKEVASVGLIDNPYYEALIVFRSFVRTLIQCVFLSNGRFYDWSKLSRLFRLRRRKKKKLTDSNQEEFLSQENEMCVCGFSEVWKL